MPQLPRSERIRLSSHPSYEDGMDEIILAKLLRESRTVCNAFMVARTRGLDAEWMTWFVAGLAQGMPPIKAALAALEEWR